MKNRKERMVGYDEQLGNINLLLMEIIPDDKDISIILDAAREGSHATRALPDRLSEIAYIVHRMLNG